MRRVISLYANSTGMYRKQTQLNIHRDTEMKSPEPTYRDKRLRTLLFFRPERKVCYAYAIQCIIAQPTSTKRHRARGRDLRAVRSSPGIVVCEGHPGTSLQHLRVLGAY